MYELHGWANIRENTIEVDDDGLNKIVDQIKEVISKLQWDRGLLQLNGINGEYHLTISCATNHRGQVTDDILGLYRYIANIASGSYGIIYIRDDEDMKGYENQFQVFVLVRGKLCKQEDPFLSPVIPVVEDESID